MKYSRLVAQVQK